MEGSCFLENDLPPFYLLLISYSQLITNKKENILNNNSHESHTFWVVIMPNMPNLYIVALARDINDFCKVVELFQGDFWCIEW